jgi:cysteinyl-tRNA synthetase
MRSGEAPTEAERSLGDRWRLLVELANVLGLEAAAVGPAARDPAAEKILALMGQRYAEKERKNYAAADALRQQIQGFGVELFDNRAGISTASGGPLSQPITFDPSQPEGGAAPRS